MTHVCNIMHSLWQNMLRRQINTVIAVMRGDARPTTQGRGMGLVLDKRVRLGEKKKAVINVGDKIDHSIHVHRHGKASGEGK